MSTGIEWCDDTWNVVTGCSKISEGCKNCYAERMAKRLAGRCGYDRENPFKVTAHYDKIHLPGKWRQPKRVFVNSMGDLFHDDVPQLTLQDVFYEMAHNMKHTFLILTKRPERMRDVIQKWIDDGYTFREGCTYRLPSNIWLGVTAENQEEADRRIPILLQIPAVVRFVSCEPMLGKIDLSMLHYQGLTWIDALRGTHGVYGPHHKCNKLDWVIAGGETGMGAREADVAWIHGLHEQARDAGVPFFFKQWGWGDRPAGWSNTPEAVATENTRQFPKEETNVIL